MLSDCVFGDAQNHAGERPARGHADRTDQGSLGALEYFVQTVAKFSVARMVCLGSNVALKVLDTIK